MQLPWVLASPGWWGQGCACGEGGELLALLLSSECEGQTERSGVSEIICSGQRLRQPWGTPRDRRARVQRPGRGWTAHLSLHWGPGRDWVQSHH